VIEVPIETTVTGSPSGTTPNPDVLARGRVRLINRTDQPVRVPAGTKVATGANIVYLTQNEVQSPPNLPSGADVAVMAEKPGVAANVRAGEVTKVLDDQLASRLAVENDSGFSGGVDAPALAVALADYERLRNEAVEKARQRALLDIEARLTGDLAIAPGSLRVRIATEDLEPRIGTPSDTLTLKIAGSARAITFDVEHLRAVVRRQVGVTATAQTSGVQETKLSVALGKGVRADNDVAVFEARVQGTLGRWLDEDRVKNLVAGKTPTEAQALLLGLSPSTSPAVKLHAFWANRVPAFPWRITVQQTPAE